MDTKTMDTNGFNKIADTAKEGIATTTETVTDLAGKGWAAAVDAGGTIQVAAAETARQIGDAAATTYQQGLRASRYVSQNTAEQPFLALLIAGAIGFGVAYMLYRR